MVFIDLLLENMIYLMLHFSFYRGQIVANLGDALEHVLDTCLPLYVNRLKNEITRLTAVRAIHMISRY